MHYIGKTGAGLKKTSGGCRRLRRRLDIYEEFYHEPQFLIIERTDCNDPVMLVRILEYFFSSSEYCQRI
jgi:hypothetical protein